MALSIAIIEILMHCRTLCRAILTPSCPAMDCNDHYLIICQFSIFLVLMNI